MYHIYPLSSLEMKHFLCGDTCCVHFLEKNLDERKAMFNYYRLSRARRIVDNSFGILAARFAYLVLDATYLFPLDYCCGSWCIDIPLY